MEFFTRPLYIYFQTNILKGARDLVPPFGPKFNASFEGVLL
jgi:hypothetical protein